MSRVLELLKSRKFWIRVFSGICLIAAAILVVGFGGMVLFISTLIISMIGLYELYRVLKMENEPIGWIGYIAGALYYYLMYRGYTYNEMLVFISALMAMMAVFVFTFPRYRTEQISVGFFGIFYVVVMLSYVFRVRSLSDGKYMVWMIFLSSWGSDSCAYLVGMLIGKHHITPILSPKKTWEGCVGGVIGAGILGFIYGSLVGNYLIEIEHPAFSCAFACAFSGIISQIGDFAASAIKRDHGIKDYGDLIPGHGGILDRFDSMLFTAPAIYFALQFIK
jgi:phosphatidate cytidylyltransferase